MIISASIRKIAAAAPSIRVIATVAAASVSAIASVLVGFGLLTCILACAPTQAPPAGNPASNPGDSAASGTYDDDADLLHGDRVTFDREFIYLDDPLFLQTKSVHAYRNAGSFAFQIPIYFNANRLDTLRFGAGSIRVKSGSTRTRKGNPGDTLASDPHPSFACVADTGKELSGVGTVDKMFQDGDRTLVFPPVKSVKGGNRRVDLNLYCRAYEPPWGREDTLSLAFTKSNGTDGSRDVVFDLPFHVSFRGPVVSFVLGVGLLYLFTQAGVWISGQ